MASTWNRSARMCAIFIAALIVWALGATPASAQSPTVIDAVDSPAPAWQESDVTVPKGSTVRWEFDQAQATHTLTSSSANWSPPIDETRNAGGAAIERTFTTAGVYTFLCKLHGGMTGSVTVTDEPRFDVLVFSRTTGFRHADAIAAGRTEITAMGEAGNYNVDLTEDATRFSDAGLRPYEVVVFLNTDGEGILNGAQRNAFERWTQQGGGIVSIHADANADRNWAWKGDMMGGAWFQNHPEGALQFQNATVNRVDDTHPATAGVPENWVREDEWYNFTEEPENVHVLLKLDESTYVEQDGSDGVNDDHPISWCSNYDGGRHFYTALGHNGSYWAEPDYKDHIRGAIDWASGEAQGDCGPEREGLPTDASFDKVTLDDTTENPMEIAVADNGDVYYVELGGKVKQYRRTGGPVRTLATIPVHRGNENGLLGITLDPNFETNRHLYLFYSPPSPEIQRVSRFTVTDQGTLADERPLLEFAHQRIICCHSSGSMTFGPDGNLYISTGDDSQHAESQGYNPIDDRLANEPGTNPDADHARDARRSSGNTNDLRGKILRIRPKADPTGAPGPGNTYDIPAGNLFGLGAKYPGVAGLTRPEIYTMGHRNPFRIQVDQETGWLYNGEVGPDAGGENANRGPRGYDELNQIREAGNMGWPYCIADNKAYSNWDFGTLTHSGFFNCSGTGGVDDGPLNDSAWNTGKANTPPTTGALLWWPYQPHANAPGFPWDTAPVAIPEGPGRTAIAGPTYHFDEQSSSATKFPQWYDDKVFFADWSRDWIATVELDAAGKPAEIQEFMPNTDFRHPHDIEMGADGSLYVLEWGRDFNYAGSGVNPDSGLYRIDYAKGARTPVARATADKNSGPTPLTVTFSSEGSEDADGDDLTYAWDFGDGQTATGPNATHTFTQAGTYNVRLTATDTTGRAGTSTVVIEAGNTRPVVELTTPVQGGVFGWGDQIPYTVTVTDPEDGDIDCNRVTVNAGVFHDEGGNAHVHPGLDKTGCSGTIAAPADSGHDKSSNIALVLIANYTDEGGSTGSAPLTGASTRRLTPKEIQAEHYTGHVGTQSNTVANAEGGRTVGYTDAGEYIYFEPVSLANINQLRIRYAAGEDGGFVDVREGALDGNVIGTAALPPTATWTDFQNVTIPINPGGTSGRLYFTFRAMSSTNPTDLFDLDQFTFIGKGVAANAAPVVSAEATPTTGRAPLTVQLTGTASDADGDALTYAWDFTSDGTTDATTANAVHTYTAPGAHVAKLTVSDGGYTRTETVTVNVFGNAGCPGSDEFDGSALDAQRWDVVRQDANFMNVSGGAVNITGQRGQDIFANDQGLENIVRWTAALPADGPWTATTKVTWNPTQNFQNAGLLLYTDDANWIKTGLVWNGSRTFETFKELNNVPAGLGTGAAGTYPNTFYLRFVSNGTSIQAQRSADGVAWSNTGSATNLTGLTNPKVALYATGSTAGAPAGGDSPKVANFDWFKFNPLVAGSDTTAPTTTRTVTPADHNGWHTSDVELRLATEDCATTQYKIGDGAFQNYTGPITISTPGTTTVTYRSTDAEGIVEADKTVDVKIDKTAPTSTATPDGGTSAGPAQVTLAGNDAAGGSGIDKLEYRLDSPNGAWTAYTGPITVSGPGQHTLEHRATDVAGNVGTVGTATYTITGGTLPACPTRDEFEGTSLNAEMWDVVRQDPAFMNVANGELNITAQRGQDIHAGDTGLENIVRWIPAIPTTGGWTATAKLTWTPTANYQNAGLVIYSNDANWIKTGMVFAGGRAFEAFKELNNSAQGLGSASATGVPNTFYLRFASSNGTSIQAQRSADGVTWQNTGNATNLTGLTNPRVALYATGSTAAAPAGEGPHVAEFDWFKFNQLDGGTDTTAPTTTPTLAPAAPNGANGWYTSNPELTLATENCATTQYKVGDGAYQNYTGPVTINSEGTTTVTYRSTDSQDNVETEKTVTVKLDKTAPTSTATPDGGTSNAPVQVTLAGSDAAGGSGVDKVEYRLDSGNWTTYSGPVTISGNGQHTLEHRATDAAGNVGAVGTGTYTITTTSPSNQAPTVQVAAEPASGKPPLNVRFTATGQDPEGGALTYAWDFGDGTTGAGDQVTHRYTKPGTYTARVTSKDPQGATATATVDVVVKRGTQIGRPPSVRAFRANGLRLRMACPADGDGRATLKVSRAVAQRLGLASRTVATRRLSCEAGEDLSLRLKPSRSTARRLAKSKVKTLKLTLTVSVDGDKALERKVTIK